MEEEIDYMNTGWEELGDIGSGINRIAQMLYKESITGYEQFRTGGVNVTCSFHTPNKRSILKISPKWFRYSLSKENWCLNRLKNESNARVPEALYYEGDENDYFPGHEILVVEYLDGRIPNSSDLSDPSFHEDLGEFYVNMHKLVVKRYGWLVPANDNDAIVNDFIGTCDEWKQFLIDIDNIGVSLSSELVSSNEYRWLIKQLQCRGGECLPALLHGDFRMDNVIIGQNGLFVIDFQNCFSGDSLYDIGIGVQVYPQLIPFIGSYSELELTDNDIAKILLYAMRYSFSVLGYAATRKEFNLAKTYKNRFNELREMYENYS